MIFLNLEKKTELLPSNPWRRCSYLNLSHLHIGQFKYGSNTWRMEEGPRNDSSTVSIRNFQAIQGHSGGNPIDPSLQDLVVLPKGFTEYIYHVGSFTNLHSIVWTGLIAGGKDEKKGRQAVFLTAVNPMESQDHRQTEFNLTKPRIATYEQNWKVHQDTVYWVNVKVAQRKGLTFYQNDRTLLFSKVLLPHFASRRR